MITASKKLKDYIQAQTSILDLEKRSGINKSVLYAILRGESPSSETIEKLLSVTGFDFEKAFNVEEKQHG